MRGPFDPILRWPFDKQVLVTLMDQSDYPLPVQPLPGAPPPSPPERADFTCIVRPDLSKQAHLEACRMPRNDREGNSSIGFVKFLEHTEMQNPAQRNIAGPSTDPNRPAPQIPVRPMYIRDDTVFFRVIVEPMDKSTSS